MTVKLCSKCGIHPVKEPTKSERGRVITYNQCQECFSAGKRKNAKIEKKSVASPGVAHPASELKVPASVDIQHPGGGGITHDQKLAAIRKIFEDELLPILEAKGHDYSGTEDAMGNLRDFGVQGVAVRIGDKYHRLKNFCRQGELKVKDESVEDTIKDLINYGFLALLLKREEAR